PSPSSTSLFLLHASLSTRSLHSFPTRRSSDLSSIHEIHSSHLHLDCAFGASARSLRRCATKTCSCKSRRQVHGSRASQQSRHGLDRKSTRLNSSHQIISYAVFCLKKKNIKNNT